MLAGEENPDKLEACFTMQDSMESAVVTERQTIRATLSRIVELAGRYPFCVLALPSIYLLLRYPILWKDIDALAQLVWRAGAVNILHYPPIYCFGGRVPFWIDHAVSSLLGGGKVPPLDLFGPQQPTLHGLYLLIIGQHLALVLSLAFFVYSVTPSVAGRGWLTLGTLGFSAFYANQQCAGSESLSVVAIILVVAFTVRVVRETQPGSAREKFWLTWLGYGASLTLAVGTRHINVVLGACLPLSLLFFFGGKTGGWSKIVPLGSLAVLLAGGALLINLTLASWLIRSVGDEFRTITGIALSARIEGFLRKLPPAKRRDLAEKLASREENAVVRAAIFSLVNVGSFEHGSDKVIQQALRAAGYPEQKIRSESERIITRASLAYLRSLHPKLIGAILKDFDYGFVRSTNGKLSRVPFLANLGAAELSRDNPEMWKPVLRSLDLATAAHELQRARRDFFLGFGGRMPLLLLLLAGAILGISGSRFSSLGTVSLALVATGALLYLVNCIFIPTIDRYTLPLLVTGYASFMTGLAAWLDHPKGTLREAAARPIVQSRASIGR